MIIFSLIQTVSRYLGYAYTYSDSRRYRWYNYTCYALCYTLLIPLVTSPERHTMRNFLPAIDIFFHSQLGYIQHNISDVEAMTELLSLCTVGPNAIFKGFLFMFRRQSIRRLLTILQRNVDSSTSTKTMQLISHVPKTFRTVTEEKQGRIEFYREAERTVRWWSIVYIAIIIISVEVACFGPIVTVLYHCWLGDFRSDMWILPIKL